MISWFERILKWPDKTFGDVYNVRTLYLFGFIPIYSKWIQVTTKVRH